MVCSFGDMLRVPTNSGRSQIRSLEQARAQGASVTAIATPQEAITLAQQHTDKTIVFFAAGFETTMAPIAALIDQGVPNNLKLLLAGRRTWPAVQMLLQSPHNQLNALIAPGHVATIMGTNEWWFAVKDYHLPLAVAGFTLDSLLPAIYSVCVQYLQHTPMLHNCYAQVVHEEGNPRARTLLNKVFSIENASWRGIGEIPASGFRLKPDYHNLDAYSIFAQLIAGIETTEQSMPKGCDCDRVILGQRSPLDCKLYQTACTPAQPVGPCMVSDEGACHIWWQNGIRLNAATH